MADHSIEIDTYKYAHLVFGPVGRMAEMTLTFKPHELLVFGGPLRISFFDDLSTGLVSAFVGPGNYGSITRSKTTQVINRMYAYANYADFDRVLHLIATESPAYFQFEFGSRSETDETEKFKLSGFNISTDPEPPGELGNDLDAQR